MRAFFFAEEVGEVREVAKVAKIVDNPLNSDITVFKSVDNREDSSGATT